MGGCVPDYFLSWSNDFLKSSLHLAVINNKQKKLMLPALVVYLWLYTKGTEGDCKAYVNAADTVLFLKCSPVQLSSWSMSWMTVRVKNRLTMQWKCDMTLWVRFYFTHRLEFACVCVRSYHLFFVCFYVNQASFVDHQQNTFLSPLHQISHTLTVHLPWVNSSAHLQICPIVEL